MYVGMVNTWIVSLKCTGLESTLEECQHLPVTYGRCNYYTQAGVECVIPTPTESTIYIPTTTTTPLHPIDIHTTESTLVPYPHPVDLEAVRVRINRL